MKIICYGDSNTWGHNPIDGSQLERPWPVALQEKLPNDTIIVDGLCGRTTSDDVPDSPNRNGLAVFRQMYIAKKEKSDLLILMLGTNDLLHFFNKTAKQTADTIRCYIKEYRTLFPNQKILIISPIHLRKELSSHPIFQNLYHADSIEKSYEFAENIQRMANEENVFFMDAAKAAKASAIDGIHMELSEHDKLAQAIFEKIQMIQ